MDALKRNILRLVARHDGEWYWYQLDRALVGPNPELFTNLLPAIKELASDGLLDIRPHPALGEIPRYWLTDAGRVSVAEQSHAERRDAVSFQWEIDEQ